MMDDVRNLKAQGHRTSSLGMELMADRPQTHTAQAPKHDKRKWNWAPLWTALRMGGNHGMV